MVMVESRGPVNASRRQDGLPEHPQRILVADDEHLVASGLANNLKELGHTVIGPASSGEEAMALCRNDPPHMALLDIRMGKVDGLEAAEVLFHELAIPVIIFSAYSDEKYVESGARIGVFNYLLKPVAKEQLRVAISVGWSRYLAFVSQNQEIIQLRERLEHRKIIEQAKWIVVQRKSITEPEAMKLLQSQARNSRRPLVDVARGILESDDLLRE
jgi:AmiR/NasT family two-component response regulator